MRAPHQRICVAFALLAVTVPLNAQHATTRNVGGLVITAAAADGSDRHLSLHVGSANGHTSDYVLGDMADPEHVTFELYDPGRLWVFDSSHVFLIDPAAERPIDEFMVHSRSLSPDRRYMAFERGIPNGAAIADSVCLVYDAEQPPIANSMDAELGIFRGLAVYPRENRQTQRYYAADSSRDAHRFVSPMTWISSTQFAFVDLFQNRASVVLVDVTSGLRAPRMTETPVDAETVVDEATLPRYLTPASALFISSIQMMSTDQQVTLRLHLRPERWLRSSFVDVPMTK